MKLALLRDRGHRFDALHRAGKAAGVGLIGEPAGGDAAPWAQAASEPDAPHRESSPIVRLLVTPGPVPEGPRVVAEATLQVKRFQGGAVEDERYTATLHADSATPAALLAALADTTRQIERLGQRGSPEDHLILTIAIRQ